MVSASVGISGVYRTNISLQGAGDCSLCLASETVSGSSNDYRDKQPGCARFLSYSSLTAQARMRSMVKLETVRLACNTIRVVVGNHGFNPLTMPKVDTIVCLPWRSLHGGNLQEALNHSMVTPLRKPARPFV